MRSLRWGVLRMSQIDELFSAMDVFDQMRVDHDALANWLVENGIVKNTHAARVLARALDEYSDTPIFIPTPDEDLDSLTLCVVQRLACAGGIPHQFELDFGDDDAP